MSSYIARRFLLGIVVIILVSIASFLIMRLLPGDPLSLYLYQTNISSLTEEEHKALEAKFGLDKPLPEQYFDWIGGVLHGDMGYSWANNLPVSRIIEQRLPVTLYIGIIALIIAGLLGTVLGVICAIRRGTWMDVVISSIANLGITIPTFWLGILLIYIFGLEMGLLPIYGYVSPFTSVWGSIRTIIMPVFCLMLPPLAGLTRQTRSAVLDVARQDYIRTAWSKGLTEKVIVSRHILKNAFIPIVTMLGMQLGTIIGGTVLIETVFSIPGIGRSLTNGVFAKDFMLVQSVALISAVMVVLANISVDIAYGWLDPRIRLGD